MQIAVGVAMGDDAPGGSIDRSVSLAAYEGTGVTIYVYGRDSSGQTVHPGVEVLVDSSPSLVELLAAPNGEVLDFDGTYAIARSASDKQAFLVDLSSNSQLIYDQGSSISKGSVANGRAFMQAGGYVWVWDGSLTQFPAVNYQAAGDWLARKPPNTGSLFNKVLLRDLANGTDVFDTTDADDTPLLQRSVDAFDVATNGDFVWVFSGPIVADIYRRRENNVESLGSSTNIDVIATDGTNIAYTKNSTTTYQTEIMSDAGASFLCIATTTDCPDVLLRNGYAAYGALDTPAGTLPFRTWRRTPAGDEQKVSVFTDSTLPEAISDSGQIAMLSGNKRYLTEASGLPHLISSALGHAIWADAWYVAMGRKVFQVVSTTSDLDAGTTLDAGAAGDLDAGNVESPVAGGLDATVTQRDAGAGPLGGDPDAGNMDDTARDAGANALADASALDAGSQASDGELDGDLDDGAGDESDAASHHRRHHHGGCGVAPGEYAGSSWWALAALCLVFPLRRRKA
jgi:MYXO-CTERM domain-containing protein